MKTKQIIVVTTITILLSALGLYLLNGCQKNVESIFNNKLRSPIIDALSNQCINDFNIYSKQTIDIKINNGNLIFNKYPSETIELFITAEGYIANNTTIDVEKNADLQITGYVTKDIKLLKKEDNNTYNKKTLSNNDLNLQTLDNLIKITFPPDALNVNNEYEIFNSYGNLFPSTNNQFLNYFHISNFYFGPDNIYFEANEKPKITCTFDVNEDLLKLTPLMFYKLNFETATWEKLELLYQIEDQNIIFDIDKTGYYAILIDPSNIFNYEITAMDTTITETKTSVPFNERLLYQIPFTISQTNLPNGMNSKQAIDIVKSNLEQEFGCSEGINNFYIILKNYLDLKLTKCWPSNEDNRNSERSTPGCPNQGGQVNVNVVIIINNKSKNINGKNKSGNNISVSYGYATAGGNCPPEHSGSEIQ